MLLEMQSKHINYSLPQTKAVGLLCLSKSCHGQGCWVTVSVEKQTNNQTKKTTTNYPKSFSVFWHYLDELCIAVWLVFTDQSRSVKSRIIALLNPFWHSLAHRAGRLTSSRKDLLRQNFRKKKKKTARKEISTYFPIVIGKKKKKKNSQDYICWHLV